MGKGVNWYYCPASRVIKPHKLTLTERFRMWKKQRERSKEVQWTEYKKWLL